jgi:alginate O-acetyltransferase complex protein AlgI
MNFNSIHYLIFFPAVVLGYFIIPSKLKNIFLLISSYYFYMCWMPQYALLIFFSTVCTYFAGYLIEKESKVISKKIFLGINIVINIGILFIFKYFNFFTSSLQSIFNILNIHIYLSDLHTTFLLPAGISFYTFQALGYSIDVYRKDIKHEKNFINYALFVSFFPQLVAGPIERSKNLLPQFSTDHKFSYDNAVIGLRRILFGMFKKVAIADTIAIYVNCVFNNITNFTGLTLLIAIFLFAVQIYCDFSGYSDIAIGSAKVLGFNLMDNFKTPYFAVSISEFWSRWHISLSTWFKDYVYIPLGGNKKGFKRKLINLFIVFLISGLWHGASWTFVIWGALHGIYRIAEELYRHSVKPLDFRYSLFNRLKYVFKVISTFAMVCFGWIFFRANTINDAFYIVKNCFQNINLLQGVYDAYDIISSSVMKSYSFVLLYIISVIFFVLTLFIIELRQNRKIQNPNQDTIYDKLKVSTRWFIYWGLSIIIIFCFIIQNGIFGQTGQFIYFRF